MTSQPDTTDTQYTLLQIIAIWAAAAIPMALLGWLAYPLLAPDIEADPLGAGVTRIILMTLGLIWQFVLAMFILYREEGDIRWATICRRFWLNTPRDPNTGQPRGKLWLWLIPVILLLSLAAGLISPLLNRPWLAIFPFFAAPPGYNPGPLLESPDVQAQLLGAWWFLGLFLVLGVFNTFLGEEFIFRGVLLPKMAGVFGKWDWLANGVLMGSYHLHQPWGIPGNIFVAALFFALPARYFRSNWFAIIAHSMQTVIFSVLILGIVLGLA